MNPYGVLVTDDRISYPIQVLQEIYDAMPETRGCEQCSAINGNNVDWCCKQNCPSMFYTEFLNVWTVVQEWEDDLKKYAIVQSIKCHLSPTLNKHCVFYQDGVGCLVYDRRPYVCRLYGIMPKKPFKERMEKLKEKYGDKFECQDQCGLVETVDLHRFVTEADDDKWFEEIRACDARLGIPAQLLALGDLPGGSYRTFYDHLLMESFAPSFLDMLSKIRLTEPTAEQVDLFIEEIERML